MLGSPPWALAIATRTNPCLLAAASCQLYPLSLHIFLWHAGLPSRLAAWALSERALCSLGVLGHAIDRHRRLLDLLVGVVVRGRDGLKPGRRMVLIRVRCRGKV